MTEKGVSAPREGQGQDAREPLSGEEAGAASPDSSAHEVVETGPPDQPTQSREVDPQPPRSNAESCSADSPTGLLPREREILAVSLPIFEGPLDLLLHLVREHRLDVFDIPIAFITERYLETIERMRELNLDVAGDFLVMAATLAHIKSRMLLPRQEEEEGEEEGGYEGDPRADLVRRLLEYQKYREAGGSLGSQDILDRDVFVKRSADDALNIDDQPSLQQVSVFKLIEALDSVLARAKVDVSHEVIRERFSLSERLTQVVGILSARRRVSFSDLFEAGASRQAIIMTFLALLEMSRLGLATVSQEDPEGDITVVATERALYAQSDSIQDDFR